MLSLFTEIPIFNANSVNSYQTPQNAASDLGLIVPSLFTEIPVFNANSVNTEQTPQNAASDLGLYSLSMSLLWGH